MKLIITTICLCLCVTVFAQPDTVSAVNSATKKPKNIILLIGDGTGLSQISGLQFYTEDASNYEQFPVVGLIKTSSSNSLITDSAAGATAFASGIKTYNGAVGVDASGAPVPTLVEQISPMGMKTGVIATSSITHATPACFYAHEKSRRNAEQIAMDLANSDIDFFAGGGLKFFNERKDNKDLLSAMRANGFSIETLALSPSGASRQGFLLALDGMPRVTEGRGDFLLTATQMGIRHLSQGENGFFLMVEGSQVDWGGHSNETEYVITELIDFNKLATSVLVVHWSRRGSL
ncbi:MAG: alkaline phosphatase [Bacteroidota bacterium]